MTRSSSSSTAALFLLLLLIGYTAAGPDSARQPAAMRSGVCQEHRNLHDRLDVVQQRVEDTVDKLEAELVDLLDIMQAPRWRPLLDQTRKTEIAILQDPDLKDQP